MLVGFGVALPEVSHGFGVLGFAVTYLVLHIVDLWGVLCHCHCLRPLCLLLAKRILGVLSRLDVVFGLGRLKERLGDMLVGTERFEDGGSVGDFE